MINLDGDWEELARWTRPSGTKEVGRFIYGIAKLINATRTLEIGVYRGYVSMALGLHHLDSGGIHYAIDNNLSRLENLAEFAKDNKLRIEGLCIDTKHLEKVSELEQESFDLIFVDGDHRYPRCIEDIRFSLSRVSKRGVVIIHDYTSPLPNMVRTAVNELIENKEFDNFYTMVLGGVFVAVKKHDN